MLTPSIAADYLTREAGKGPLPGWPYVPPLDGAEVAPQARAG
nr:hypothetical protein [Pyxidicoccus parkwaysis]